LAQKDEDKEEVYVFEFYDDEFVNTLEDEELQHPTTEYNEVDFEEDLNEELRSPKLLRVLI
jgi:actin-related protein